MEDLGRYCVVAWCIHPDLIPAEVTLVVPEPKEVYTEHGLFLRLEEIIHSKQPLLRYKVAIHLREVQDWHSPSDSSDGGTPLDTWDSDGDDYPGFDQPCRSRP